MGDFIGILDAGSQYAKLIDRRLREENVNTEIFALNTPVELILSKNIKGLIISGGPNSVNNNSLLYDKTLFSLNIPILGICYGMQLMVQHYGGKIEAIPNNRQDGVIECTIINNIPLYCDMAEKIEVLLTHGDSCTLIPSDLVGNVTSSNGITCGLHHKTLPYFGVQFHPEVDLTTIGKQLFKNFIFKICNVQPTFTITSRLNNIINEIKTYLSNINPFILIGNDSSPNTPTNILVLFSGGVDSLVCSTLLSKIVKKEFLHIIHIDHGFMRLDESQKVKTRMEEMGIPIKVFNCFHDFYYGTTSIKSTVANNAVIENSSRNLNIDGKSTVCSLLTCKNINADIKVPSEALKDAIEPEIKRKIIGDVFMKITKCIMKKENLHPENTFIVQGTLRPDLIESASFTVSESADVIKTHHNDTAKVRKLRKLGKILEPLKDFHKDEVRKIGLELGLEPQDVYRQPFPGPGLAIRYICSDGVPAYIPQNVNQEDHKLFYLLNYNFMKTNKCDNSEFEAIEKTLSTAELNTLFMLTNHNGFLKPLILPIKTVGVQGDGRSYKHPLAIFSDNSPDWSKLYQLSKFITKSFQYINRIVYGFGKVVDIKIIKSITPCRLNKYNLDILKLADNIVYNKMVKYDVMKKISQFPVILIPIQFENGSSLKYSIVLRPFISNDFMTGLPALPNIDIEEKLILKIVKSIHKHVPCVSRVLYDITGKPPGTTEWE